MDENADDLLPFPIAWEECWSRWKRCYRYAGDGAEQPIEKTDDKRSQLLKLVALTSFRLAFSCFFVGLCRIFCGIHETSNYISTFPHCVIVNPSFVMMITLVVFQRLVSAVHKRGCQRSTHPEILLSSLLKSFICHTVLQKSTISCTIQSLLQSLLRENSRCINVKTAQTLHGLSFSSTWKYPQCASASTLAKPLQNSPRILQSLLLRNIAQA